MTITLKQHNRNILTKVFIILQFVDQIRIQFLFHTKSCSWINNKNTISKPLVILPYCTTNISLLCRPKSTKATLGAFLSESFVFWLFIWFKTPAGEGNWKKIIIWFFLLKNYSWDLTTFLECFGVPCIWSQLLKFLATSGAFNNQTGPDEDFCVIARKMKCLRPQLHKYNYQYIYSLYTFVREKQITYR